MAPAHTQRGGERRYAGESGGSPSRPLRFASVLSSAKKRVYAPLETQQRSIGWKELNAGVARVMQTYCGEFKSGAALQEGLRILGEIRETEAAATYAANPHDLAHVVECLSIITAGEAVIQASLARKASSALLSFSRLDYPDVDPAEWHKLLSIKSVDGKASIGDTVDYTCARRLRQR